ncbi:Gfo/Idh/MocA family protein [Paenibacillus eucommiae]|uniref:Virulence factor n=1 Tax=Paenibacillus eucommiae TaxID=1355755 RepID=A0ABS4J384_9BACL|nr:Gfo/Idh/MocA family oxidoreductase [Paenibacillus eucommiae]MBP1993566.1 virulence factor [Paenibacillus eucommiae]
MAVKKRIGLIGLGDIAQKVYLPLLAGDTRIELAGIMSRKASTVERIQEQYRLPFGTTKLDELLGQTLDAVFIHSPTETHYPLVMACLRRGLPVYVDKPLSYVWKESLEMAAFAEQKGVLLGVGFNRRFAPLYAAAKDWLREAGGFQYCSAVKHRTRQQTYSAAQTIYDDLIHMLDLLLWLGEDNGFEKGQGSYRVNSHTQQTDEQGRLIHASGSLSLGLSTASGALPEGGTSAVNGVYSMVRLSGTDTEKLELHGNGRSVEVTNLETATFFEKGQLPAARTFGSWETVLTRRGFTGVVQHFLDSLEAPEHCLIRADLVLDTHKLVEELLKR